MAVLDGFCSVTKHLYNLRSCCQTSYLHDLFPFEVLAQMSELSYFDVFNGALEHLEFHYAD